MSRPEAPIRGSGPLVEFAGDLRALRISAGLSYREMADGQGFSHSTMSKAAAGKQLPTLEVTLAFVRACRGDVELWARRWHALLDSAATAAGGDAVSSPSPSRSRPRDQQSAPRESASGVGAAAGHLTSSSTKLAADEERSPGRGSSLPTLHDQSTVDAQFMSAMQSDTSSAKYKDALNALTKYGLRIIAAWIRTGRIFQECAAHGRYLATPKWFDPEDVDDLISDTVAEGLMLFQAQIEKQRWDPDLGASSTTYFIGSCTLAFPNVLRRHTSIRGGWQLHTPIGVNDDLDLLEDHFANSPEDEVVVRSDLRSELAKMTSVQQKVLLGSALEMSHADIAVQVGLTTRAVEGQLRRARAELRKRLSLNAADQMHGSKARSQDRRSLSTSPRLCRPPVPARAATRRG